MVSPFSSGKDPIREVPIDRFPGHPVVPVVGLVIKMSISVAFPSGAFGSQMTLLNLSSSTAVLTADQGVTIRNANVIPGAISDGRGHFSMYRSLNFGVAPSESIPFFVEIPQRPLCHGFSQSDLETCFPSLGSPPAAQPAGGEAAGIP